MPMVQAQSESITHDCHPVGNCQQSAVAHGLVHPLPRLLLCSLSKGVNERGTGCLKSTHLTCATFEGVVLGRIHTCGIIQLAADQPRRMDISEAACLTAWTSLSWAACFWTRDRGADEVMHPTTLPR